MAKEQIIYLGPEEELTNVRERLENTNAGRIILVIPPQTQLRSHVGWRLLRSRVRELGLDVLIISSDRQIRAVAKAAGFRVADSFESPPSDRPRPINRPVRSDMNRKISHGTNKQVSSGNKASRSLQPDQQQVPPSPSKNGSALSNSGDMNREFDTAASSTFEIEDVPYDDHYELPYETVPPPHSGVEDQEDGEVDPLVADYYLARSIREAAQSPESGEASSVIENAETSGSKLEQSSKIPQPSGIEDDPFAYMEDIQPIALPEQRASTFIHDIDQGIPDISDVPTDVHDVEVEDLGDDGEVTLQRDVSPQSNRMGNTVRPSLDDFGNEDDLLPTSTPIPDQPTRITPSSPARVSTPSTTARREPQPMIQPSPQTRNVSINPTVQQSKKPITSRSSRIVTNPSLNRRAGLNSNRNVKWILAFVSISLGVLLLALLAFIYFGSNAMVTVVVPSQSTKQHVASATGPGTATGTIKQGNASGIVTFSNKGSSQLDIPTGTVLSTSGPAPVQFVTTADALVPPDQNNNIPSVAPVQAQMPGESGNVAASSITIIPPDSLTKIAQNSQQSSLASGILTVTNPSPTSRGGSANVQVVTSSDANTLTLTLQQQVQQQINFWLTNLKHQGYEVGKPEPIVLASPTSEVGKSAPGGKFTGVLSVKVSVTVDAKGLVLQQVSVQQEQQISQQLAGKSIDQAKSFIKSKQAGFTGVVHTNIVIFPSFLGFMPFRAEQIHIVVQPAGTTPYG